MKKIIFFIVIVSFVFLLNSCSFSDITNKAKELTCNHDYKVEIIEATCTTTGKEIKVCSKCGKSIEKTLPISSHLYGEWVIDEDSTCAKEGSKHHVCLNCGHEEKESIEKTSHSYGEWVVDEDSTCAKEGSKHHTCINCSHEETSTIEKKPHELVDAKKDVSCTEDGYDGQKCLHCDYVEGEIIPALGHAYSEWVELKAATDSEDGLKSRTCTRCSYEEKQIISKIDYIDLTYIKIGTVDFSSMHTVKSFKEASDLFNVAVLYRSNTLKLSINFAFENIDALLDGITDGCTISSYSVNASMIGTELTLNLTYQDEPSLSASTVNPYVQYESINFKPTSQTRSLDFDDFKINYSAYTLNDLRTTDQLFYCLEHGAKPICVAGSKAETMYNKIKVVLRSIIDNNMTDLEKVVTIHDWLAMNICYDNDLLELAYLQPSNLQSYKGFHLDGVFDDYRAVCEGISQALCVMCNIEGIRCVQVTGIQTSNPEGVGHAWNKVFLNGDWYVIDATSDNIILNGTSEVLSHAFCLISEATMHARYTETDFTNIICSKDFDLYDTIIYDDSLTLKATSQEEVDKLVKYFEDNASGKSNITFEFEIGYECNISQAIANAYSNNHIYGSYSTSINGNKVMLIK